MSYQAPKVKAASGGYGSNWAAQLLRVVVQNFRRVVVRAEV